MQNRKFFFFIVCLLGFLYIFIPEIAICETSSLPETTLINTIPACKSFFKLSHRTSMLEVPENTIEGIQKSIELGMDGIEIDVSTTRDGKLILMHDQYVDRVTDGSGWVSVLSLKQIKKLNIKTLLEDYKNMIMKVPTLEEALLASKGKILIFLDIKAASPESIVEVIKKTGTEKETFILGSQQYKKFQQLLPNIKFYPNIKNEEDMDFAVEVLHTNIVKVGQQNCEENLIKRVHEKKLKIILDVSNTKIDIKKLEKYITIGIDGLQTDYPADIRKALNNVCSTLRTQKNF